MKLVHLDPETEAVIMSALNLAAQQAGIRTRQFHDAADLIANSKLHAPPKKAD